MSFVADDRLRRAAPCCAFIVQMRQHSPVRLPQFSYENLLRQIVELAVESHILHVAASLGVEFPEDRVLPTVEIQRLDAMPFA